MDEINNLAYRKPLDSEKRIIERLLGGEFFGRDQIRAQINNSLVKKIDEDGSLRFDVKINVKADVRQRIPIEAECEDSDGVTIHVLLHVVEGTVYELEIYKDDSSKIVQMPDPKHFRLLKLDKHPEEGRYKNIR